MEFQHSFDCGCGRTHRCGIRQVLIGSGVLARVPSLLKGMSHVLIVSDRNTRPLALEALAQSLGKAGIGFTEAFFDQPEVLIPDEKAIARIQEKLAEHPAQALIGIGSGVINDLCKHVSFLADLPYMIIASAPSMDGFASVGAALILKGMKVTLNARTPAWIVGDTRILKDAPMDMIRAGIGDILGKVSCLNDWKLAHVITGEYLCETIYDMTMEEVLTTREHISGCLGRDEEAIGRLMASLVKVGIAMAYMGNSRPASGAEHHLSHFFEITGVAFHEPYLPHGIDVAYSTILTARLRRRLAQEDPSSFRYAFDEAAWEEEVRKIYGPLTPEVLALQKKTGLYQTDYLPVIRSRWEEIRRILLESPAPEEVTALLQEAGYDFSRFTAFYGEERIRSAIRRAKDLKDRYTLFWILENAGLLEAYSQLPLAQEN